MGTLDAADRSRSFYLLKLLTSFSTPIEVRTTRFIREQKKKKKTIRPTLSSFFSFSDHPRNVPSLNEIQTGDINVLLTSINHLVRGTRSLAESNGTKRNGTRGFVRESGDLQSRRR